MSQFFVFRNMNRATQKNYPYLLDIQSYLLSEMKTTVAIPLMSKRLAGDHTITKLNPVLKIKNESFSIMTQNIAGIDREVLGEKVADLNQHHSEIVAAIDFVLAGI